MDLLTANEKEAPTLDQLHAQFVKVTGSTVSRRMFSRWTHEIGLKPRATWYVPGAPVSRGPSSPIPIEDDDEDLLPPAPRVKMIPGVGGIIDPTIKPFTDEDEQ